MLNKPVSGRFYQQATFHILILACFNPHAYWLEQLKAGNYQFHKSGAS